MSRCQDRSSETSLKIKMNFKIFVIKRPSMVDERMNVAWDVAEVQQLFPVDCWSELYCGNARAQLTLS